MTPEEKIFSKHEKDKFMVVGFTPPEMKQFKGWLYEKHITSVMEMPDGDAAWQKLELSNTHCILIKGDTDESDVFLGRLLDSRRFINTPIMVFSKSHEVYKHSYEKRNMTGRFFPLPVNLNDFEKAALELMQAGKVEVSQTSQMAGVMFHYNKACALLEDDKFAEAKDELRLSLKEDPHFFDGYLKMGEALVGLEDYETALRVLRKGNEIHPDDARTFYLIGLAEFGKGGAGPATEEFGRAIALEPQNVRQIMDVGNVFLEKNMIDEALRFFNMAQKMSPEFLTIYNRIGIALSRAGRFEEAEQSYNRALKIDAKDPGVYFNLAMMWHRKGTSAKAAEFFKKCLELNPAMTAARDMLAKL